MTTQERFNKIGFFGVDQASSMTGASIWMLYEMIDNDVIASLVVDGKRYISLSMIEIVKGRIVQCVTRKGESQC